MNFLAHCALGRDHPDLIVGGFLGDFLKGGVPELPGHIATGVRLHRRIDAMTQEQPAMLRSVTRLGRGLRRTGPIFVDLAADHFLAREFERYHAVRLEDFTGEAYRHLEHRRDLLPPPAARLLDIMLANDLLAGYREHRVLEKALLRMAERLRRPELGPQALRAVERDFGGFAGDFAEYYPALQRRVERWLERHFEGCRAETASRS